MSGNSGALLIEDDASDDDMLFPSSGTGQISAQNLRLHLDLTNASSETTRQPTIINFSEALSQQQHSGDESAFVVRRHERTASTNSTSPLLVRRRHISRFDNINQPRTLLDIAHDSSTLPTTRDGVRWPLEAQLPINSNTVSTEEQGIRPFLRSDEINIPPLDVEELSSSSSSLSVDLINNDEVLQSGAQNISVQRTHSSSSVAGVTLAEASSLPAAGLENATDSLPPPSLIEPSAATTAQTASEFNSEASSLSGSPLHVDAISEDSDQVLSDQGSPMFPGHGDGGNAIIELDVETSEVSGTPVLQQPAVRVLPSSPVLDTQADFREVGNVIRKQTKGKRKLSSPTSQSSTKKVTKDVESEDDDDGLSCPICFEPWTNSGKHRLVSLRCGHLFGQRCVERWIKDCHQKCPQCNAKAKRTDIRVIYAKKIQAIDTADLEQALKIADEAKNERRERDMELAKVRMRYQMALDECKRLKMKMTNMTEIKEKTSDDAPQTSSAQDGESRSRLYQLAKTVVIHAAGECRIMDFDSLAGNFAISQPSPHANFISGFGVKKLSALDLKSGCFTKLHSKTIKDLKFNPLSRDQLLSVSVDGCLRITNLSSNTKVHEYQLGKPAWSCCWHATDKNYLFAGLNNGTYMQFDLRNTAGPVATLENPSSKCPVVSLYHIPPTGKATFRGRGGLLSATLQGAVFWQEVDRSALISNFKPTFLPLEPGSCTGIKYCHETQHCLVTFRPGRSYPTTTHLFCEMQCTAVDGEDEPQVTCHVLDTFLGGRSHKMITRNALFAVPPVGDVKDSRLEIAIGDEANRRVQIYDAARSTLTQTLLCEGGPPLDIAPVFFGSQRPMLATLSQSTLNVYTIA